MLEDVEESLSDAAEETSVMADVADVVVSSANGDGFDVSGEKIMDKGVPVIKKPTVDLAKVEKVEKAEAPKPAVLEAENPKELVVRLKAMDLVRLKLLATDLGIPNAAGMAYKPQVIREVVAVAFPH